MDNMAVWKAWRFVSSHLELWTGRAVELRELVLTLGRKRNKEVRLLTLTGAPGVGKTSLGDTAETLPRHFRDTSETLP